MKMILATLLFIFSIITGCGEREREEAPPNVIKTFAQMFKGATSEVWTKDKNNIWKAKFSVNGIETIVKYNSDGSFKEKEEKVPASDVPPLIYNYFSTYQTDSKIRGIEKITAPSGSVYYEVGLKSKVVFDSSGQLLREHRYK